MVLPPINQPKGLLIQGWYYTVVASRSSSMNVIIAYRRCFDHHGFLPPDVDSGTQMLIIIDPTSQMIWYWPCLYLPVYICMYIIVCIYIHIVWSCQSYSHVRDAFWNIHVLPAPGWLFTCIAEDSCIYIYMYIYIYVYIYMYIYIYVYIYMYIYIYICIYIYMYIYIYICIPQYI